MNRQWVGLSGRELPSLVWSVAVSPPLHIPAVAVVGVFTFDFAGCSTTTDIDIGRVRYSGSNFGTLASHTEGELVVKVAVDLHKQTIHGFFLL